VESAMYVATIGPLAGQYVAGCAKEKCGYLGKSSDVVKGSKLMLTFTY
jgi:hypothetical protein